MGRNVAEQAWAASNLAKAIQLRIRGANWQEIAAACDFASPAAALTAVGEAMKDATGRAEESADQMRDTANLSYDALSRETWKLIEGRDELLETDEETGLVTGQSAAAAAAVTLRAIDEARRIVDARAKLNKLGPATEEKTETDRLVIVFETED